MKTLPKSVRAELSAAVEKNQTQVSERDFSAFIIASVVLSIAGIIAGAALIFGANIN